MLKPRKRITKKQLKEDKLVTFYFKASEWLEKNTNYLLMGVVAVVLIIAGSYWYINLQANAEKNASVELARGTRAYDMADYQNALTLLSGLVDNYAGTPSHKIGRFYLANTFYKTGDYANARMHYQKFISSFNGTKHFLVAAMGGIAACFEQEQKYAEAADQFENAATQYSESVLAPQWLMKAARNYTLASNTGKAEEMYKKVIEDFPKSQEKDDALMLLAMLYQK